MVAPATVLYGYRPDIAGAFMQFDLEASWKGFIALKLLPVVEVNLPADRPGKMKLADLLKTLPTERAPGSPYSRGKFEFDTWSYNTKENGSEYPIDDNAKRRYRYFFDLEVQSTMRARDAVLRNMEVRVAAIVNAIATTTAVGGGAWTQANWANATPVNDVETAQAAIFGRTGYYANTMAITETMFRNLRNCSQVLERAFGSVNPSDAERVTTDVLARVFALEQVTVAGAVKNTANEKQAASLSTIWGDASAKLLVTQRTNDPQEPGFGRTFHWSEDGSDIGATVEIYRDETVRGDVARARMETDEVVMYPEMGQLITGISA